jgi:hypothetical protein
MLQYPIGKCRTCQQTQLVDLRWLYRDYLRRAIPQSLPGLSALYILIRGVQASEIDFFIT